MRAVRKERQLEKHSDGDDCTTNEPDAREQPGIFIGEQTCEEQNQGTHATDQHERRSAPKKRDSIPSKSLWQRAVAIGTHHRFTIYTAATDEARFVAQ